mmetsp:Transcript_112693/g.313499  ORF Transcript_112693/g.313499 Transcript_112693/m.313499 type:complete len:980 (-) Transcript_112693:297-3236(-)
MHNTNDELVRLLVALCSSESASRVAAEQALASGQLQPGFPAKLATFAVSGLATTDVLPLRQMGLTILKRLAWDHWAEMTTGDQDGVRSALLRSLTEQTRCLRSLLHACIANVRARGGPWPALHAELQAGIVHGTPDDAGACLECVALLLEECSFEVVMSLGCLQGPMLTLAASDMTQPALRRECINAHMAGVNAILAGDACEAAVSSTVHSIPAWSAVHAKLCTGLEGWSDSDHVACAFTAVRTVTAFSRLRPLEETLAGTVESVLRPACLLVQKMEPAYENAVIFQDDGGASEEEGGVSQFITQLMELIQSMLMKSKLRSLLKGHIRSMVHLLVPFMRITEAQVKAWRADPNEFLAHEEDDYARGCAIRLSGESLVGELLCHSKREGLRALAAVMGELLERGERRYAAGEIHAWKLLEVALFLFGNTAAEVPPRALQRGELAPLAPAVLSAAGRLCADVAAPEFLRARAFALLRRLGDAVCALAPTDLPALLHASAAAVRQGEPLSVRVCACRSFCRFLVAVEDAALRDALLLEHGVLVSLGCLTQEADEELLHLALESLCIIAKQCPGAVASAEAALATLVLKIWRRCAADPLVHLQVLDLVSCASSSDPRLQLSMEDCLLPVVKNDLCLGADPHLTASAIELYGVLIKRASVPFNSSVWDCVELLLATVMRSDESGLVQNACDVLCCLLQRSPRQLSDGGHLEQLLRCLERLLGPDLDDDACLHVGQLVMLSLSQFSSLMPSSLTVGLLRALVARLVRAERPYLKQELVVVLARLLYHDLQGILTALSAMQIPTCGSSQTGLEVFLSTWLAITKEIRARSARNVTVSALCRLHERCLEDKQLQAMRIGDSPLVDQLLAAIVAGLEFENERCQKLRDHPGMDVGSEEDDDDAADADNEDDCGGTGQQLSDLVDLDLDELSDGSAEGDCGFQSSDPLHKLDLRGMATEYLAAHEGCTAGQSELADRLKAAVADARAHP